MKKRFLSGLMAVMILCALFPTVIFAEETDFGGDTPCARSATVIYLWLNAGPPKAKV